MHIVYLFKAKLASKVVRTPQSLMPEKILRSLLLLSWLCNHFWLTFVSRESAAICAACTRAAFTMQT